MDNNMFQHKIFKELYDKYNPPSIDIWKPVNDLLVYLFENIIIKYWYVILILFIVIVILAHRYNNKEHKTNKKIRSDKYNDDLLSIYTEPKISRPDSRILKTALAYNDYQ